MTEQQNIDVNSVDMREVAGAIVASYLENNQMPADQVPKFIRDVMGALEAGGAVAGAVSDERPTPAVPIRKSVAADHVTCLVCGKRMKALKRHIRAAHDMTEQEYREAFDLPRDHPMVSRNYSRQRAEMAKRIGLGQTSGRRRSKK